MLETLLENSIIYTRQGPQLCKKLLDKPYYFYIKGELIKAILEKSPDKINKYMRVHLADGTYFDSINDHHIGEIIDNNTSMTISPTHREPLLSELLECSQPTSPVSPSRSFKERVTHALKRFSRSMSSENTSPESADSQSESYKYGVEIGRQSSKDHTLNSSLKSTANTTLFDDYSKNQYDVDEILLGWRSVNQGIIMGRYVDLLALHSILNFNGIHSKIRPAGIKYILETTLSADNKVIGVETIYNVTNLITINYI